nr:hypothetical protein [Tanacetum cinerariifolium]
MFGKIDSIALEDYTDICLEHLSEIEIKYFGSKKPELEFVKLILAKSPALKKVSILLERYVSVNKVLKMRIVLLDSPSASSMADINFECLPIKIRRSLGSVIQLLHSSPITYKSIKSLPTSSFASANRTNNDTRLRRTGVSFFQLFLAKSEDVESLKQELLESIAPLDRGADARVEQQELVDQVLGFC